MKHFLRHLFLPHHTNNFKPRILHTHAFFSYAVFFVVLTSISQISLRVSPDILGYATNITIDSLISQTNQKRQEAGLSPLTYNEKLAQAAAGKAADMFGNDYWAHNSPSGKTPWDFILGAGYRYAYAGENLAKNFEDSTGVMNAWMESPTHKENIMRSQYSEIGFAVVNGKLQGEEVTLVVQMFGTPQGGAVTGVQAAESQVVEEAPVIAEASPSSEPVASGVAEIKPSKPVEIPTISALTQGVVHKPLIDIGAMSRRLMLILSGVLIVTFVVDGLYIWRKKIVRISGKNLAHILFLSAITGIIWLAASTGTILAEGLHI